MPIEVAQQGSELKLTARGELTIYQAQEEHGLLRSAWTPDLRRLSIDLGEVTEIDSAGVQLLLSLRHQILKQGGSLRVLAWSDAAQRVLKLYRLQDVLGPDDESVLADSEETMP